MWIICDLKHEYNYNNIRNTITIINIVSYGMNSSGVLK